MSTSLSRRFAGRLTVVAGALLLTACAATTKQTAVGNGIIAADQATAKMLGAPGVSISAEHEFGTFRQIRARLRVTDDAYVLVVNVAPDGAARILFPETPADDGLLRGNKSYLLPHFFGGYPAMSLEMTTSATRFVRVSRSALASPMVRGPGYTFVLASRTPFDMQRLEDEGFFDGADVGRTLEELNPDDVMPIVAEAALGKERSYLVSSDVARYAGYDPLGGAHQQFGYASGHGAFSYCNAQFLMEWPYLSTRSLPDACYLRSIPRIQSIVPRVVPLPVSPPPADSGAGKPEVPPSDPGERPVAPRRPRPVENGEVVANDKAIELDRFTRDQMRRQEREMDAGTRRREGRPAGAQPGRLRMSDEGGSNAAPSSQRGRGSVRSSESSTRARPSSSDGRASRPEPGNAESSPRSSSSGADRSAPSTSSSTGAGSSPAGKRAMDPDRD